MSEFIRFTDLTSLRQIDTETSIAAFVDNALSAHADKFPAAICVYPSMVESAALAIGDRPVALASVCGAFPSGQTYLEVKLLEVAMAIENGADEIDMVIDLGAIIEGRMDVVEAEIRAVMEEIDGSALLKIILETGVLQEEQLIYDASMVAMSAGADFIKTSTGKTEVGATTEAVRTMCRAVRQYNELYERMVGIKIAGGVRSDDEVRQYIDIVREELGDEWITPALLRFGRSKI